MITRIISAIVGLIILFFIMFSNNVILFDVVISVVSFIGIYELLKAYGYNKYKLFIFMGIISSLIFSFANYYSKIYLLFYTFLILLILAFFILKNHNEFKSKDIFTVIFINTVIPMLFMSIGYIKTLKHGEFYVWFPFLGAWVTDTFAYFTGRFFGKHKLCSKISPKKTIEGSIGGTTGAILGFFIYVIIIAKVNNLSYNPYILLALSVTTSILSQVGDLFFSVIKREQGIKDFGNLIPGHGGIIDRFDSLVLTTPYVLIFISIFEVII